MVLGFTLEDEPIRKAVNCMTACLRGERKIDNYSAKKHDWDWFTKRMLSTWVKIFDPANEIALDFARQWAYVAGNFCFKENQLLFSQCKNISRIRFGW